MLQRRLRRINAFLLTLLAIEFLDELVFGAREAAWPFIRNDLGLSYAQIGLLIGIPAIIGSLVEPALGILGDVWVRRRLILGGGVAFGVALALTAASAGFPTLLGAFTLLSPASGAFVSLSQASLMDLSPRRREQNMARWTFAGSLGVVAGPLTLALGALLGLSWRGVFLSFLALTAVVLGVARRFDIPWAAPDGRAGGDTRTRFRAGLRGAWRALRRGEVLRWLALLEFSDLMLDVLYGYLALYFVDVVGVTPVQASLAVAVWTGVGLLGDLALIPLLERVSGLAYLRVSAALELLLYPAFLLLPGLGPKLVVLGLLGLFNAGWYSVLMARLYGAMPGQSGTVMTVGNIFGMLAGLLPVGLGLVAERYSLEAAMWLLWLGPIALMIGMPIAGRGRP